ncbi:hypothetical protein BBF96_04190 [Anoxybacter fermentans]|uniref:DNA 3'-5' helicase n=1 Tax=Anoxybacter fermentans TaxID=1323375 RepID=A0A3Q9HPN5_9FIRM|nr:RNA polymerase recycling motor HelD [Anoxybacter fermentans]AZR72657.1 hypothetical protein BBF96_04190 [Anoxybacter fermentans]
MLKEHPAYQEELDRLEMTKKEVEKAIELFSTRRDQLKGEIVENLKEFRRKPDENSQTYINILTGIQFVKFYNEKLNGLERSRKKPYFARIDFTPQNGNKTQVCYIGKTGLTREEDNYPVIIDWRAPIANLYYEGRLGKASYKVPDKTAKKEYIIEGNLTLKRQFNIEDGELKEIFDIDITTNDPLLQKSLGAHADNRLKDIAATIQAEQNRIIRANLKQPLIVQGVAGSGKTTVALHRIAYLIYTYEKVFDPETFMIIAPNRLFLNYISEVLPELGVERVKQTTFIDFMLELLDSKIKLANPNQKLTFFVNNQDNNKAKLLKLASKFKSSLTFKKVIDKYLNDIEENFIPKKDLKIEGETIITSSEIKSIFLSEYKYYPIYTRISKLKKRLNRLVKKKVNELIENEQAKTDREVDKYYLSNSSSEKERQRILKIIEERDRKIKDLEKRSKTLVKEYLTTLPQLNLLDYYKNLITDPEKLNIYTGGHIHDKILKFIAQHSAQIFDSGQIELEDLAPLVYLKYHLYGIGKRPKLSHVVIDEAQDLSLFQLYLLRKISRTDSFTIMGDLAQGIHSYRAINNWEDVIQRIFPKCNVNYTTLEKSYRTTIEIMNLANQLIKHYPNKKITQAKPIIRHGELPYLLKNRTPEEIVQFILEEIRKLKDKEFKTIAIIGKTIDECKKIYNYFPEKAKVELITEDMNEYEGGIMILPSYLAKGLEFDAVFIVTFEEEYQKEELDIKLLYIAMTRALHRLYLCSKGEISPLLKNIDKKLYQSLNLPNNS